MSQKNKSSSERQNEALKADGRRAAIGGFLAALTILGGSWMSGQTSGSEAQYLLETVLPSVRSFSGTLMLALGTILALMLTLLGLSASADIDLKWFHYQRIKQIALVDMVTFIVAVLVYLLLNVPIQETDSGTSVWFYNIYYATLIISSLLAGAIITIVLMLYNAIRNIIHALGPQKESFITRTEEEE